MFYDDEKIRELIEDRVLVERKRQEEIRLEDLKSQKSKARKLRTACLIGGVVIAVSSFTLGGAVYGEFVAPTEVATSAQSTTLNDSMMQTALSKKSDGEPLSVAEIANLTADSVVEITTESVTTGMIMQQYITEGAGSGVVITSDGYIVTNNHVINGANKIKVTLKDGSSYEAKLIGKDAQTDLAVIKIDGAKLQPATLGDSDQLVVGELAVAIGNPLGQLGGTVTDGIISALNREITLDNSKMNLLQTNAAINPGNSGGGLFDGEGKLIGVVVAKSAGSDVEGLGFAIPVNDVKKVVNELINNGYVTGRPVLGVSVIPVESAQMAMQYRVNRLGVYIAGLTEGTHSVESGLQVGDCIIAIDNQEVSASSDISKILQTKKVGDKVSVTVSRNGQMVNVNLVLSEYVPSSN